MNEVCNEWKEMASNKNSENATVKTAAFTIIHLKLNLIWEQCE